MIRLTERALAAIAKLAGERAEPGQLLRFSIKSGGCSGMEYAMEFAHPAASDEEREQDGMRYLVDVKSLKFLEG